MKKILCVLLSAVILIGLTACGGSKVTVEGGDLIKAAQKAYTELDSGKLIISDTSSGEEQSTFTFRYEGNVLHYLTQTKLGDIIGAEFNDGKQLVYKEGDSVETYKFPQKEFKKYKRSDTHPNASAGMFFYEPDCMKTASENVADVKVTETDEGTSYFYDYDIALLSKKMTTETAEGKMTVFSTEYVFDKDGNFVKLIESSTFEIGEDTQENSYTITITDRNAVDEIINTIQPTVEIKEEK